MPIALKWQSSDSQSNQQLTYTWLYAGLKPLRPFAQPGSSGTHPNTITNMGSKPAAANAVNNLTHRQNKSRRTHKL